MRRNAAAWSPISQGKDDVGDTQQPGRIIDPADSRCSAIREASCAQRAKQHHQPHECRSCASKENAALLNPDKSLRDGTSYSTAWSSGFLAGPAANLRKYVRQQARTGSDSKTSPVEHPLTGLQAFPFLGLAGMVTVHTQLVRFRFAPSESSRLEECSLA